MPKVMLDPGHTKRYNKGAVSGYYEGTVMFEYAYMLGAKLALRGLQVGYTRGKVTENPSLVDRGKKAKGYDLFVSLHSNGSSSPAATGVSTFYSIKRDGDKPYAADWCKRLAALMGIRARGASTRKGGGDWDYYTVIQYAVKVGCPHAFIIEHGFHTNPAECAWLLEKENLEAMADLECDIICDILGVSYDKNKKPVEPEKPIARKMVNTPDDTLNVRDAAVYTAKKLGELAHESIVDVYGLAGNGWMLIQQGKLRGWVNGGFLVDAPKDFKVRILAGSLHIRKGPGTNYDTNGVVHGNEVFTIVEKAMNGETPWGKLEDGRGWISLNPQYSKEV